MEFGRDGYFFVYDLQGRNLMHPRQPELVGQELWDLRDTQGQPVIQNLLAAARRGGQHGEAVHYLWERPSTRQNEEKLGYVVVLERWGWMLGTGIYLTTSTRPCSASTRRRRPTSATCSPGSPASPPSASWAWPPAGWR